MGGPRGRWEDAFRRDALDVLQVGKWKTTGRRREGWRKEIGEDIVPKTGGRFV